MNTQLANLSTDLRRISYWIYQSRKPLVNETLSELKNKYKINSIVGPYKNIWKELDKIKHLEGGRVRAADRASTMSSILLQESLKR